MAFISIMQGRLGAPEAGRFQSFPRNSWRNEFPAAELAGLDGIEWIYDLYGADENPLTNDHLTAEMVDLAKQHKVTVRSVCADYFMDLPILRQDSAGKQELFAHLKLLLGRCADLSISRLVLPFVDISKISSADDVESVVAFVGEALPTAIEQGVEIHLETDLPPSAFRSLLDRLDHPFVWVNYDSGNSSSLGYNCTEELAAYGERIGNVHIKDRVFGGGTVPLGEGDADLPSLFSELAKLNYGGDFVLQVARSTPGDEIAWAAHNKIRVEQLLVEAGFQR